MTTETFYKIGYAKWSTKYICIHLIYPLQKHIYVKKVLFVIRHFYTSLFTVTLIFNKIFNKSK